MNRLVQKNILRKVIRFELIIKFFNDKKDLAFDLLRRKGKESVI
jgi:hypothetical protein